MNLTSCGFGVFFLSQIEFESLSELPKYRTAAGLSSPYSTDFILEATHPSTLLTEPYSFPTSRAISGTSIDRRACPSRRQSSEVMK